MNRDELKGKAQALKGKVEQATGDLTDNPRLRRQGVADEVAGETRAVAGRVRRKVGEAVAQIGKAVKK